MGQSLPEIQHQFFSFHIQDSSSYAGRSDYILTFDTVIRVWLLIYRLLIGLQIRQLTLQKLSKGQTIHRSLSSVAHSPSSDKRFTTSFHISFVWSFLLLSCTLTHLSMESATAFLIFLGLRTSTLKTHLSAKFCSTQSQYCQPLKFKSSWGFNAHFPDICCFLSCLDFCPSHYPVASNQWLAISILPLLPDVPRE